MKAKGSTSDFIVKREAELRAAYRQVLHETTPSSSDDFFRRVSEKGCSRFWVSEERAAIVMGKMDRGESIDGMKPEKQRMYRELYDSYRRIREKHRHMSVSEATFEAVNSPARRFYLSPATVRTHLYRSAPARSARI